MTPAVENHSPALPAPRRRISDDGTSRSGNRSGGGWQLLLLVSGKLRTPSGRSRHDIIAGGFTYVNGYGLLENGYKI